MRIPQPVGEPARALGEKNMTKQQALNQLRLMQAWHEDFGNGPCPDYDAICYAIGVIEEAPEGLDNFIKALEKEHKKLLEMQKAQPETDESMWKYDKSIGQYICIKCGANWYYEYMDHMMYCPSCGRKMEGIDG